MFGVWSPQFGSRDGGFGSQMGLVSRPGLGAMGPGQLTVRTTYGQFRSHVNTEGYHKTLQEIASVKLECEGREIS